MKVRKNSATVGNLISLFIWFLFLFYFLQAIGPVLVASFSKWSGIFAPFGTIMRFLAPGPDDALLAFIEAILITVVTAIKKI